jgi:hypothetical protein
MVQMIHMEGPSGRRGGDHCRLPLAIDARSGEKRQDLHGGGDCRGRRDSCDTGLTFPRTGLVSACNVIYLGNGCIGILIDALGVAGDMGIEHVKVVCLCTARPLL